MNETVESPRFRAVRRLSDAVRQFPELNVNQPCEDSVPSDSMPARDKALADAIEYLVRARWITLLRIIEHAADRPGNRLEPKLQAVLLAAAAQLLLMDRVPAHAVIDDSVDIARTFVRPGAAGMTNAVLRRIADLRLEDVDLPGRQWDRDVLPLGDGRGRRLRSPVFASERLERCAEQTSHPLHFLMTLNNTEGHEAAMRIAAHNIVTPPIIVTNVQSDDPDLTHHDEPGFFVLRGGTSSLHRIMLQQPKLRVQDPSSAHPVCLTRDLHPRVIIDACAGRGTKTRQLRDTHPDADIIAFDINPDRRALLNQVFAGDPAIRVAEPEDMAALSACADLLLLDLPCSNTAVLPRRPEAKYRFSSGTLDSLQRVQRQIIANTVSALRPGGTLLLATCSLLRSENEDLARWTARTHRLKVAKAERRLPIGLPGDPPTAYQDGSFAALLTS